ncbi:hypothetical protein ACHAXA_002867 [Cyclostephanos tholiformis]|uniref:Uncharacterized protein n=1 Tax=Cyclostephanos tholiformis TaxID=382380 RepID=A0ABD3SBV4_9STRA
MVSVAALLSVVSLLGANASAREKNGRDAGGKGHHRNVVGYPDKIVEDWTDDGWHADGWETPILCKKPETWSAPQWKINTKKTLTTIDQWEEPAWSPPAPKWDAPSEPDWSPMGWGDASSGNTQPQLRGSKSGKAGKVGKASSSAATGEKGGKSGGEVMTEYSEEGGWSTGTEWNRASTWAGGGRRLVSSWSMEEVKSPVIHSVWGTSDLNPPPTWTNAAKAKWSKSGKWSNTDKTTSYRSWPSPASSWKNSGWKGSLSPSICQPAPTHSASTCDQRMWYFNGNECTNDINGKVGTLTFQKCCGDNFPSNTCIFVDSCNPQNEVLTLPPSSEATPEPTSYTPTYYPTVNPTFEPTSPPTRKPTTQEPTEPKVEVLPTPPPSDNPTACPPPTPGVPSMPGCPTPAPTQEPTEPKVEVLPTPPPSNNPTACPPPTPGVPSMPGCPTPAPTQEPTEPKVEVLPTPPPSDNPTACPPPTPGVPPMPGCPTPAPTQEPTEPKVEVLPTPPPSDNPTACPPPTPGVPSMPGCPTPAPTQEPTEPKVEVLPTPPPSDNPTACPPPTPGVPSMPGCPTPAPTQEPTEPKVEVLPTPPPSIEIFTYSPTFGSTPTVSKETTGPPTLSGETRSFEDVKTDCVKKYEKVVSTETSNPVEVCVYVCTITKTKYERGVPIDTEVKNTNEACP